MDEPSLLNASRDKNLASYRLTILPTWGNAVAVRIQKQGQIYLVSSRRLSGEAGFKPGKLIEKRDFHLPQSDSIALENLIVSLRFFEMPETDDAKQSDGDEWVLEGVSGRRYHVIRRCCAGSLDTKGRGLEPFLTLCKFLIDHSQLSERPKDGQHELL